MADVKITVLPNGPLLVEGETTLQDAEGKPIESATPKLALCRCGASNKKPFCDGSHSRTGFQG
ncbi:MAG: CDGSH iron-sulfur domain-containing protein [Acidobacteria bacterium]|jgi:CDGSH-type Zn-finger protein|nr:CDGSH iron-sulfur domain-containing protein [Acidobacteriota bacterium]